MSHWEGTFLRPAPTLLSYSPMEPDLIRVLIADDHPFWRQGIRELLSAEADISVVAEAANGKEALRLIRSTKLDVALLDMEMPLATGVEVAQIVKTEEVPVRVLALSSYDDAAYVTSLLENGASGYITKDKPPELIIEAVRAVAQGEGRWFVTPVPSTDSASGLSSREQEVIELLAKGHSNNEIGEVLFISGNTVRNHLANAYSKIGVKTAREAVAWAWKSGFIQDTD